MSRDFICRETGFGRRRRPVRRGALTGWNRRGGGVMTAAVMGSRNLAIGCLSLFFVWGCTQENGIHSMTFSGTLEMTEYSVGAPVPGRIAELLVDEEEHVQKGQVIATLEHFQQAKKDYARAEELTASGGVSQQDYEHLKQAMDDQQVVAPVDGVVLVKVREAGEVVPAGEPIVVIGKRAEMWVKVFIPEDVVSQVKAQQQARISVDGLDETITGHVSYVATKAEFTPRNIQTPEERATQTFAVKIILDQQQLPLRPGVTADVNFE